MASTLKPRLLVDLRVAELKVELENRGLDKVGNKAVLVSRLSKAIQEDGRDPSVYNFDEPEQDVVEPGTEPAPADDQTTAEAAGLLEDDKQLGAGDKQETNAASLDVVMDAGEDQETKAASLDVVMDAGEDQDPSEPSGGLKEANDDVANRAETEIKEEILEASMITSAEDVDITPVGDVKAEPDVPETADIKLEKMDVECEQKHNGQVEESEDIEGKDVKISPKKENELKSEQVDAQNSNPNLWIEGLQPSLTAEKLKNELEEKYGPVKGVKLVQRKHQVDHISAYITMEDVVDARKAHDDIRQGQLLEKRVFICYFPLQWFAKEEEKVEKFREPLEFRPSYRNSRPTYNPLRGYHGARGARAMYRHWEPSGHSGSDRRHQEFTRDLHQRALSILGDRRMKEEQHERRMQLQAEEKQKKEMQRTLEWEREELKREKYRLNEERMKLMQFEQLKEKDLQEQRMMLLREKEELRKAEANFKRTMAPSEGGHVPPSKKLRMTGGYGDGRGGGWGKPSGGRGRGRGRDSAQAWQSDYQVGYNKNQREVAGGGNSWDQYKTDNPQMRSSYGGIEQTGYRDSYSQPSSFQGSYLQDYQHSHGRSTYYDQSSSERNHGESVEEALNKKIRDAVMTTLLKRSHPM